MTLIELTQKVVKKAIRSAACIDDEYLGPYEDMKSGLKQDKPAELYRSFRKDANCDLDIYHYESFEKWSEDKEFILNSKDLLILDWELDKELPIKYENTIKILEEALTNPYIYFIIIHTHSNDAELIYKNLLFNFAFRKGFFDRDTYTLLIDFLTEEIASKLKEKSSETFDQYDFDEKVDEFKVKIKAIVNGYTYNLNEREQIAKKFYEYLNKEFEILKSERLVKKTIEKWNIGLDDFFNFFDMHEYFENFMSLITNKEKEYSVKEIKGTGSPTLFINNTLITIFAKENSVESTLPKVSVHEVFPSLTNCITKLPNNSLSAIIALEFKDLYRQNMAAFGKGLAGVDERALAYHLNGYSNLIERYEYLLQIWNNQVSILTIMNSSPDYLPNYDHFEVHKDVNPKDIEKELVEFISNIMIMPRLENDGTRALQFGDIFKTEKPLRLIKTGEYNNLNYEYLLCITPACDCSHPHKINNNFSFLYGKIIESATALQNSEIQYYTFLNDKVIEWSNNPFTLFIENTKLESIITNYIRYNDISLKITHVTTMKELFTQRISNHAYSNNIRIGLDLPHIRKK